MSRKFDFTVDDKASPKPAAPAVTQPPPPSKWLRDPGATIYPGKMIEVDYAEIEQRVLGAASSFQAHLAYVEERVHEQMLQARAAREWLDRTERFPQFSEACAANLLGHEEWDCRVCMCERLVKRCDAQWGQVSDHMLDYHLARIMTAERKCDVLESAQFGFDKLHSVSINSPGFIAPTSNHYDPDADSYDPPEPV